MGKAFKAFFDWINVYKLYKIFFLICIMPTMLRAENTWIHMVGINEMDNTQNYSAFYKSAADFNKKCEGSSKTRCHLLINNDRKHRSLRYDDYPENLKNIESLPKGMSYADYLQSKITKAKAGDTVIISLQNHGTPVKDRGASCVWMNSTEQICETDLERILKKKPRGVKVVISGNACFSGGFAQLSSSEVCTVTTASRLNVGYTQLRSLWNAASERNPKTLSDLRNPIIAESGQQMLMGSQVIMQQLCADARAQMSFHEKQSLLLARDNHGTFKNNDECRDVDITARKLHVFSQQVLDVLNSPGRSCVDLNLPLAVCEAQGRLKDADADVRMLIQELQTIAQSDDENYQWSTKNKAYINSALKEFAAMSGLSPEEKQEINDSARLGIDPDWSKFDPTRVEMIKEKYFMIKPLNGRLASAKTNQDRTDAIYASLKSKGYYEDLLTVQNCLMENKPDIPNDEMAQYQLDHHQNISSLFPEKKFTPKDYEDARKCESSVSF